MFFKNLFEQQQQFAAFAAFSVFFYSYIELLRSPHNQKIRILLHPVAGTLQISNK